MSASDALSAVSPAALPPIGTLLLGTVVDYDFDRGLGTIVHADTIYAFHCTAIADGTRRIEPNTSVSFGIGPAGPGRWEARDVQAI